MGDEVDAIEDKKQVSLQYYPSVDHALDVFCSYFDPTLRVLRKVDTETRRHFLEEVKAIFSRYNRATNGTAIVEKHYLQTITTRA